MAVPHIFGASPEARFVSFAGGLQSRRTLSCVSAAISPATLPPVGQVFGSAIGGPLTVMTILSSSSPSIAHPQRPPSFERNPVLVHRKPLLECLQ